MKFKLPVLLIAVFVFTNNYSFGTNIKYPADTTVEHALIILMQQSADDWNKGNLQGFMDSYDDSATMMTAEGLINKDSMTVGYKRTYFKNGAPVQQLTFDQLQVITLDKNYVILTGRFMLSGGNLSSQTGRYSLVCVRRKTGWKILHDHTS